MCTAGGVTSIIGTEGSAITAGFAADEQEKVAKKTALNIRRQDGINQLQLYKRRIQEQDAATLKKQDLTDEARANLATARTGAAEAGVGGNGVRAIVQDIRRQQLAGVNAIDRNQEAADAQLALEQTASRSRARGQIRGLNSGPGRAMAYLQTHFNGVSNFSM